MQESAAAAAKGGNAGSSSSSSSVGAGAGDRVGERVWELDQKMELERKTVIRAWWIFAYKAVNVELDRLRNRRSVTLLPCTHKWVI